MTDTELMNLALEARTSAYAPYSGYTVGAALLCGDGKVYTGCNIENAAFSATVCAERTAFFKAVSDGKKEFSKIAVCGGRGKLSEEICTPCGVCRQVMAEFCDPDRFVLICMKKNGFQSLTLRELLPYGFGAASLDTEKHRIPCEEQPSAALHERK